MAIGTSAGRKECFTGRRIPARVLGEGGVGNGKERCRKRRNSQDTGHKKPSSPRHVPGWS
jgi:hypothetical protein